MFVYLMHHITDTLPSVFPFFFAVLPKLSYFPKKTQQSISETRHNQGSYRQDCVKFKDFSRTSRRLCYCFQGLKT